jgi:hypothetical protein
MRIKGGPLSPKAIFLLACLTILVSGCRTGERSFASPEDVAHILENCAGGTCSQLSASLHLGIPLRPQVCSVSALRVKFEPASDDALLKIECSQDFGLLLLVQESGRWQYADSMALPWGAHDAITVGLRKLIDPSDDAIIIHGDTVGFGTGIYQSDFLVVRVLNRKLHVVLDTVEKGSVYPPQSAGPNRWVEQRSSFEITPADQKKAGSVTEMMTLNVGGKEVVLEREFDWRKEFGHFEPSLWAHPSKPEMQTNKKKSG